MSKESVLDHKRRLSRDRSARFRALKTKRLQAIGATKFKMIVGAGTVSDIEYIRQIGSFEENAEAVTLCIRFMAAMARRDEAAFLQAINPRSFL